MRNRHPHASRPELWIGRVGPMTDAGIYRVVKDRAEQAGVPHAYAHLFRHTFAHIWLSSKGTEGGDACGRLAQQNYARALCRRQSR